MIIFVAIMASIMAATSPDTHSTSFTFDNGCVLRKTYNLKGKRLTAQLDSGCEFVDVEGEEK